MKFLETSAKENTNVGEAFNIMAKEIISQSLEKEKTIKKGLFKNYFNFYKLICIFIYLT